MCKTLQLILSTTKANKYTNTQQQNRKKSGRGLASGLHYELSGREGWNAECKNLLFKVRSLMLPTPTPPPPFSPSLASSGKAQLCSE